MKPLRLALNVAACVLFPAFAAGALTFVAIDRIAARCRRSHPALTTALTGDAESWFSAANTEGV